MGGTYYLYRTLRNLDLDKVMDRLVDQARQSASSHIEEGTHEPTPPDVALTGLEERLLRDEYQSRIDQLRKEIEAEIRRRLVADRGSEALAKSIRKPLPEDIDVMHATRDELVALRKSLAPLSRKLAVRLARKRRHGRKGPLDFRSTMRHALSTGGVPMDPKFRYPRPSKPEIIVIADISGSVASFARFTLHLVHAISSQFSKVRSFVFIDGIDEVTAVLRGRRRPGRGRAPDQHRGRRGLGRRPLGLRPRPHACSGSAGARRSPRRRASCCSATPGTTTTRPGAWVVKEMQARARHVYWLNPEPRAYWDSGDSVVGEYATYCDEVVECRTLRQLERFVGELA